MAEKRSEAAAPGTVDVADLLRQFLAQGGIPITLSQTPLEPVDTAKLLTQQARRTVAFTPCADELLALYRTSETDDLTVFFKEYFKFKPHRIFGQTDQLGELDTQLWDHLDPALLQCGAPIHIESHTNDVAGWPSDCCICPSCVTLDGNRNAVPKLPTVPSIKRLFAGDLLWLFYIEQMGVFQILGVILDAYASNGRIPISNGALDAGVRDDVVALVLEVMVRQTKMGLSSTVRDRAGAYRTCLGWTSTSGRKLKLDTQVHTGFNTLFHQFIFHALEFFNVRRMGVAIRGSASPAPPPSVATLITISDTLEILKKGLEVFNYGRSYTNTLNGIVWAIAAMKIIRELGTTLGIPPAYSELHEIIPAAYDLLVLKRPVTSGTTNRFLVHRELARNGRDILMDIEVIAHEQKEPGGELERWLNQVEGKVEAYRTAYRSLTGVDLGVAGTPVIEQQV